MRKFYCDHCERELWEEASDLDRENQCHQWFMVMHVGFEAPKLIDECEDDLNSGMLCLNCYDLLLESIAHFLYRTSNSKDKPPLPNLRMIDGVISCTGLLGGPDADRQDTVE